MRKTVLLISLLVLGTVLLWTLDPALAGNKFEKISGGVIGSSTEKRQLTQIILGSFGALLLLGAALAAFLPHNNPLYLNYATWRQSAILMGIFGTIAVGGAALL